MTELSEARTGAACGRRPADVCALCDRPIDLTVRAGFAALHLYVGPGWVHGGGREEIPVHWACVALPDYPEGCPMHTSLSAWLSASFVLGGKASNE